MWHVNTIAFSGDARDTNARPLFMDRGTVIPASRNVKRNIERAIIILTPASIRVSTARHGSDTDLEAVSMLALSRVESLVPIPASR
jgi:hypothetical protein